MKHHIIVKWNNLVENKKTIIPGIKEIFEKTLELQGIHKVELIENIIDRPNRYDLMIRITMDENILETYDKSLPHHEWKTKYSKYIESKAIFDSND